MEVQSLGGQNPDWKNTGGCRKQSLLADGQLDDLIESRDGKDL